MIKTYKEIHGWYDYENLYNEFTNLLKDDSIFVEIGVWKGKSICHLATNLINKKTKLYAIDTFEGTFGDSGHQGMIKALGVSLLDHFKQNLIDLNIKNVTIINKNSIEASKNFNDETIDIIFIDADHSYEAVKKDLHIWYPKVKLGGIIAGHDYFGDWPGVKKAVDEFFSEKNIKVEESLPSSWKVIKK